MVPFFQLICFYLLSGYYFTVWRGWCFEVQSGRKVILLSWVSRFLSGFRGFLVKPVLATSSSGFTEVSGMEGC